MRIWAIASVITLFLVSACNKSDQKQEKMVNLSNITDNKDRQLAELNKAIDDNPSNPQLYSQRAMLLLGLKSRDSALTDIEKAISLDSTKALFFYNKAKILRESNKIAKAFKAGRQAELKEYNKPELYVLMGEMYFIVKEYQKSIDYLNQALRLSPFNEYAYFYKGMVYAESGDTARAISSFQTSVEQEPGFSEGYNQLIKVYNAQKEHELALQYATAGLRFIPTDPYLWYNQGVSLQLRNLNDSAMVSFRRAVFYDSTMAQAHYNLGILEYEKDNYDRAAKSLEKAYRYNNRLPQIKNLLADSYEKAGMYEKALVQYQELSREYPADASYTESIRRVSQKKIQPKADTAAK